VITNLIKIDYVIVVAALMLAQFDLAKLPKSFVL
jgi:hypothetical protein